MREEVPRLFHRVLCRNGISHHISSDEPFVSLVIHMFQHLSDKVATLREARENKLPSVVEMLDVIVESIVGIVHRRLVCRIVCRRVRRAECSLAVIRQEEVCLGGEDSVSQLCGEKPSLPVGGILRVGIVMLGARAVGPCEETCRQEIKHVGLFLVYIRQAVAPVIPQSAVSPIVRRAAVLGIAPCTRRYRHMHGNCQQYI